MPMTACESNRREPLWVPVIGPVIWSTHFTVCYIAVALWCGRFAAAFSVTAFHIVMAGTTAIALAAIAACFLHGFRGHRSRLPDRPHDEDTPEDRQHFVAFTTMLLAGLSFIATGYAALALWMVPTCH